MTTHRIGKHGAENEAFVLEAKRRESKASRSGRAMANVCNCEQISSDTISGSVNFPSRRVMLGLESRYWKHTAQEIETELTP
jgi:hypothetical protein